MILSIVFFFSRKAIGRFQAHVILGVFQLGEGRQPEIAAGLASVWLLVSVLVFISGFLIFVAALIGK